MIFREKFKGLATNNNYLSQYKAVISYGLINKALLFVSGYIAIIVLNQLLGKEIYGELVFFQSLYAYLAVIALLGFDKLIIYKISGASNNQRVHAGGSVLVKLSIISTITLLIIEALVAAFWFTFQSQSYTYESYLIALFSINSALLVISTLCEAYLQANKHAASTLKVSNVISLIKLIILALIYITDFQSLLFLPIFILIPSLLHSLYLIYILRNIDKSSEDIRVESGDLSYSLKMMFTKFSHVGIERIDLLMIGFILTTSDVAEYAIAAKVAILVGIGNDLLSPHLSPRLKYKIENGSHSEISREYNNSRRFSSIVAMQFLFLILFFGKTILGLFGNYEAAYGILCILGLAFYNQVAFGPNGRLLALLGHSNIILYSCLITLAFMVMANYILIPHFGQHGAAIGTYLALISLNGIFQLYILRSAKLHTLDTQNYIVIVITNVIVIIGSLILN